MAHIDENSATKSTENPNYTATDFEKLQIELAAKHQQIKKNDAEIEKMRQHITQLNMKIAQLQESLDKRFSELSDITVMANDSETKLREIIRSTSWRVTKPLRFLKRNLSS